MTVTVYDTGLRTMEIERAFQIVLNKRGLRLRSSHTNLGFHQWVERHIGFLKNDELCTYCLHDTGINFFLGRSKQQHLAEVKDIAAELDTQNISSTILLI